MEVIGEALFVILRILKIKYTKSILFLKIFWKEFTGLRFWKNESFTICLFSLFFELVKITAFIIDSVLDIFYSRQIFMIRNTICRVYASS